MVAVIDQFLASAGPAVSQVLDVIWQFLQLFFVLGLIAYGFMLWRYDTKVNIRELSKGGRIILSTTRAVVIKEKKTGAPKLKFFGIMGFRGEVISQPPAECLVPCKSRLTAKTYDFVKKDGLYYPIQNFVLGMIREVEDENGERRQVYTIQGSGLEVNRDFDSEQAIQNKLIEEATQFRNRKPTEIIASFALMIITIIVSGIIMWFAWKQFGNMAGAIASLREPLKEGIIGAAQGIIGPG